MAEIDQTGLLHGVGFAFVIAALHSVAAIIFQVRRQRNGRRVRVRRPKRFAVRLALTQIALLVMLGLTHRAGFWTLSSVGVSNQVEPLVAFAAGFGEYFLFAWACSAFAVGVGAMRAYSTAALRANALLLQPWRAQRALVLGVLSLANPVTEELYFRGLLVYQFHSLGAPLGIAIGLGAVVSSLNHAYQGRVLVLFHLAFYASAVALLYSPLGLCGAIGLHFAADVMPWLGYRKQLSHYRAMRRQARRAKPPQTRS
ncbi:MAG TPA: CPBP family intramembrane glutamic endopeptidase [Polyangiaceae bacterium]|nr:CPBP family intramembrane glutamic endopeptidase [Polyangiaceae bacterium]